MKHSSLALFAGLALLIAACSSLAAPNEVHLALLAYSTPQEAYAQLIPAFRQTASGSAIGIDTSFGSSGAQTQAVINGLGADVVALSLASDVTKLVNATLVDPDWHPD